MKRYGLLSLNNSDKVFLIEKELLVQVKESLPCWSQGGSSIVEGASFGKAHISGLRYSSPFISESSASQPFVPSDHVSSKQGTGLVHIAPALGHDDFKIGLKHGLENQCVIDAQGKYTNDDVVLERLQLTNLKVLEDSTTNRIKVSIKNSI